MHDTARRILGHAATVKAAAAGIDTSRTETVPADALAEGDVILSVDGRIFPFPFTLSAVQNVTRHGVVTLRATHGWFTMTPLPASAPVVRVVGTEGLR